MRPIIILQTYKRTGYALQSIHSLCMNWAGSRSWYVADDGSPKEHVDQILGFLSQLGEEVIGHHSEKLSYGGSANRAWDVASEKSPITLWLEDDWDLREPLDPKEFISSLTSVENIGMIRLGYLSKGLQAESVSLGDELYWHLDPEPVISGTPVFTGHPSLRHIRYREAYGDYPTRLQPGDTEMGYAYQFLQKNREKKGLPQILYPVRFGLWGPFAHIGSIRSYDG